MSRPVVSASVLVEQPGPLLTVQDLGRPGLAALGVPESGALDPAALRLANRLVGNDEAAAGLETTLGGVNLRARGALVLAVTGAPLTMQVDGRARGPGTALHVRDGALVELGQPTSGLRSYIALRGGVAAHTLLGSASTDLLSGLQAPLVAGDEIALGPEPARPLPAMDHAPAATPSRDVIRLRAVLGPRHDWFTPGAHRMLAETDWSVDSRSNRIGLRLDGPSLERARDGELASEGTVAGSIQVPGNGKPLLFLADHPVTGGYPVIAVVVTEDLPLAAQAAPGQRVRLQLVAGPDLSRKDER